MLKIGDYFVIAIIIIITFFLMADFIDEKFSDKENLKAVVTVGGIVAREITLSQNQKFEFKPKAQESIIIEVDNDKIRIKDSSCNDKICIGFGWLSQKGDTAICLPLKTIVKIAGGQEVDTVAY